MTGIFLGLKFSIPGFFGVGKFGKFLADFRTAPYINFIAYTFCNSNSIHARSLCKRVSMTVMHV